MKKAFYQDNLYLDGWKKELDDESINKLVLNKLLSQKKSFDRILDVGTGSGVQIRRNIELGLLKNGGTIIGLDINKDDLINSMSSFKRWAKKKGFNLTRLKDTVATHKFTINKGNQEYTIILYEESVYYLGTKKSKIKGKFPLVTGLSLLEHTNMERCLGAIKKIMEKPGFLYLNINCDLQAVFSPTTPDKYDCESNLMRLFNYSGIDNQFKGGVKNGNSRCGSLLPILCKKIGFEIQEYGSSDWIILPGNIKPYSKNRRKMLKFLTDAFYKILKGSSTEAKKKFNVSEKQIEDWYKLRKNQLDSEELHFSCVQKDILCLNLKNKGGK